MLVVVSTLVISRLTQSTDFTIAITEDFLKVQHVFQYDLTLVFGRTAIQDSLEAYSLLQAQV